jgi:trimethylamine--corrinoid protein Co-methyltransferase
MTLAGTLACANAETLSGMVISQLVNKGTPFIIGNISTAFDQRTGIMAYGAPEFGLINAGQAALAQYYKLPFFGTGCTTDSKVIDGQALAECSTTALMAVLCGTNLIHDCGYLESGMTASIEMLVACDEVADMCFRLARGMEVSDETLATDVIHKVGPGGHFLAEKHSLRHGDEFWTPTLMDRNRWDQWVATGSKDLAARAREKAEKILKEHRPEPIPASVQKEIDEVLRALEKRNA